jgi:hypothetical protein
MAEPIEQFYNEIVQEIQDIASSLDEIRKYHGERNSLLTHIRDELSCLNGHLSGISGHLRTMATVVDSRNRVG